MQRVLDLRTQLLFTFTVPRRHEIVPLFEQVSPLHRLALSEQRWNEVTRSERSVELTETDARGVEYGTAFTGVIAIGVLTDLTIVTSTRITTIGIRFDTFVDIYEGEVVNMSLHP